MLLNVVKHCGEYLFYSYFSRYSLFVNNDKHKILDCWVVEILILVLGQISALGSNICDLVFLAFAEAICPLACAKDNFSKWLNPTVNLSNLNEVSEEFWEIVPTLVEHHNYLSPVLNPLFNSFMCCQVLALSARPHNLLITTNL